MAWKKRLQMLAGTLSHLETLSLHQPWPVLLKTCLNSPDEEGPEGLTQFLLLEVRKLREQLRNSRMCERRLSQRCRMAEEERGRAERKAQELRHDRLQLERYVSLLSSHPVLRLWKKSQVRGWYSLISWVSDESWKKPIELSSLSNNVGS